MSRGASQRQQPISRVRQCGASPWGKAWTVIGVYRDNGQTFVDHVGPGSLDDARKAAPEGVEVVAVVPGKVDSRRAFYADNLEIF